MIRILLAGLLSFVSVSAVSSGAEAQGRNCSIVGSFFVDKSGPENEAIVDMMDFAATGASEKLAKAVTDQVEIDSCAVVLIEETKFDTSAAIVIQSVSNSKTKLSSSLVTFSTVKDRPGCEDVAALDPELRIDRCSEHSQTYFLNEVSGAIGAVHAAKEPLEQTFVTSRTSVLDQALKTYGLEAPALKVEESLMSMRSATAAPGLVLKANGYIPKLFTTELWERRLPVDARAEKIVGSLLFLNGLGKAFVDRNFGGPKVVDLKDFGRPSIGTLMGYDLLSDLTDAMEKEGYKYSPGWTTR